MSLHSDLSEFVGLLNSHEVEYLVVGGHAVAFHGYPRYTGDIDIFIRSDVANARRLLEVLAEFGFGELDISLEELTTPGRVVQLGYPPNRIDLLTGISGLSFETAWQTRKGGRLAGHEVNYVGLDALIANKLSSDRDKDRHDVERLRTVAAKRRGPN